MTVSQKFDKHATKIKQKLSSNGLRVDLDNRAESIPKKVREAQLQKIPLMLTIGEKEVKNNTVAVRTLNGQVKFGVNIEKLREIIVDNINNKKLTFEF